MNSEETITDGVVTEDVNEGDADDDSSERLVGTDDSSAGDCSPGQNDDSQEVGEDIPPPADTGEIAVCVPSPSPLPFCWW